MMPHHTSSSLFYLFITLISTLSLACNQGLDLGVDDDTRLHDLSEDEARQVCENFEDYYNDEIPPRLQQRISCTFEGIQIALFSAPDDRYERREVCLDHLEECLMEEPNEDGIMVACHITDSSCDATAGELKACMEAVTEANLHTLSEVDCDLFLDDSTMMSTIGQAEPLPECAPIEETTCHMVD